MLNFEPGWPVRGVFASILGAEFNHAVKTLLFGLLGGVRGRFGYPWGYPRGSKIDASEESFCIVFGH